MPQAAARCRVAFIGTRDVAAVPEAAAEAYIRAATATARSGLVIVTGAAAGADQIAASLAISLGGPVHLVLPWASYEDAWVRWALAHHRVAKTVYDPLEHAAWTESVFAYHPVGRKLAYGALALHARNYGIVCSASFVVALPKDPAGLTGGTAQGLRVARALRVPAYNIRSERDRTAVASRIARLDTGVSAEALGQQRLDR